jgi:hypothetical protein
MRKALIAATIGLTAMAGCVIPAKPESVFYKNCAEVAEKVGFELRTGDPGYSKLLDPDGNGIACENLPSRPTPSTAPTSTPLAAPPSTAPPTSATP